MTEGHRTDPPRTVVLASASPARLRILTGVGIRPVVHVSDVDENRYADPDPRALVRILAEAKAQSVAGDLPAALHEAIVVGCDSMLELDGSALGKPGRPDVAAERWRVMRGRTGILHTGHCVIDLASGRRGSATASTSVAFAEVSDDEIEAYVATGEPVTVAGAFTLDGFGGAFVTRVEGDHHNVLGLSLTTFRDLLARIGVGWLDVWQPAART